MLLDYSGEIFMKIIPIKLVLPPDTGRFWSIESMQKWLDLMPPLYAIEADKDVIEDFGIITKEQWEGLGK